MKTNRGFTLIEVMVALVILVGVILAGFSTTAHFAHTVTIADIEWSAINLAEDRITEVRMSPDYESLDTLFTETESGFPSLDGFVRTTVVSQVGGPGQNEDHKKITVTVTAPALADPVTRTLTVAAP
jgi:prepilin-type N-terminal cleavage/methylation domain-containing protein